MTAAAEPVLADRAPMPPVRLTASTIDDDALDALYAERDALLPALAAWLSAEAAHHRAAAPKCRIPEGAQAQDGMAAGLEIAAHAVAGLAAGWGLPVSGRGGAVRPSEPRTAPTTAPVSPVGLRDAQRAAGGLG